MIFSNLLSTLSLVSIAVAVPATLSQRGQNVIIGYRTVTEAQGKRYNDAGTPTDDGNLIGTQIGKGVYTTPGRGQWPGPANPWQVDSFVVFFRYCVILSDSDALDRVSKAWIPEKSPFNDDELWDKGDDVIGDYIKELESTWDPAKTLRMSIIKGKGYDDVQLLIPPGLLNSNGGAMGLTAKCSSQIDDIPDSTVNYDDWQNNIKENRQ